MRFKELDAYLYFYSAYIKISILIKKTFKILVMLIISY